MARVAQRQSTARRAFDRRLEAWRVLGGAAARPSGGWVRALREALGMTASQLGERMGISESAVVRLEHSERDYRSGLETLRRAATALDAELVYALVPRRPLEEMVRERAREVAQEELSDVEHSMLLEAQQLGDIDRDEQFEEYVAELLRRPGLWRRTR